MVNVELCFTAFSASLTLILLMWRIGWSPSSIPIYSYIQRDATSHSLFISGNCSTWFGWYFHPSSGAHTTVSTASDICHTVTAICRYRGRVGTGWNVLWMTYAWKHEMGMCHIMFLCGHSGYTIFSTLSYKQQHFWKIYGIQNSILVFSSN
jgi:hypothetical protein